MKVPDTPFVTGYEFQQLLADKIYITPTGGSQTTLANALASSGLPSVYPATAFGGVWDATHDVGPAINAAIDAAGAGGGGSVVLPAGSFGLATTIAPGVTGVHLIGAGVGAIHDNQSTPLNVTRLVWIGAPGGTMCDITPAGTVSLYSMDVRGIVFDGANLANNGLKVTQVSNSVFYCGASNCRSINIWFTTKPFGAFTDGPGNQNNDCWLWSNSTSGSFSPTGILIDGGAGSHWNTSFNQFHLLWVWYAKGDGVVFGWGDNNLVGRLIAFPDGTNHGGNPVVFANDSYVAKNGIAVNGSSVNQRILKTETSSVVTGYQANSTVTPGTNGGTAALNTITLSTSGTLAQNQQDIPMTSVGATVLTGMVVNATGGWSSGIAPNTPVLSVSAGASVKLASPTIGAVANGLSCVFSYGITTSAAHGTYVMTAVDGTHWSLTTAPAGGHTQTNIAVANGAISFTDMVIPLTGTPNTGDTFTIFVPFPATNILFEGSDSGANSNFVPIPMVEAGGLAYTMNFANPWPVMQGGTGDIIVAPQTGTTHNLQFGGYGNVVSGAYAVAGPGGLNNLSNSFASMARGQSCQAGAIASVAEGGSCVTSGSYSRSQGLNATDRARFGADVYASGLFAAQGDAQTALQVLRAATTDATVTRLTSDQLAPTTINTVNLPNNGTYRVSVEGTAHQTGGSSGTKNDSATWTATVMVKRGANAAATSFVGGYYVANSTLANTAVVAGTGFIPTISDAAAATWTLTLDVDTTNGGVAVSGTGQANKNINWVARITSTEAVG